MANTIKIDTETLGTTWELGTEYYVVIVEGVGYDEVNYIDSPAVTSKTAIAFTTQSSASVVKANAEDIPRRATDGVFAYDGLIIYLDESVKSQDIVPQTGDLYIKDVSTDTVLSTYDVTDTNLVIAGTHNHDTYGTIPCLFVKLAGANRSDYDNNAVYIDWDAGAFKCIDGFDVATPIKSFMTFPGSLNMEIISTVPADNASAAALDTDISITFNEDAKAGEVGGVIKLYETTGDVLVETFDPTTDGTFTNNVWAVTPAANLETGIDYYVIFEEEMAVPVNQTVVPATQHYYWTATGDYTPSFTADPVPYITTWSSALLNIDSTLSMTFSADVIASTGQIHIKKWNGSAWANIESIGTSDGRVSFVTDTLTFDPGTDYWSLRFDDPDYIAGEYYIALDADAVKTSSDSTGNAALDSPTSLDYDTAAPHVIESINTLFDVTNSFAVEGIEVVYDGILELFNGTNDYVRIERTSDSNLMNLDYWNGASSKLSTADAGGKTTLTYVPLVASGYEASTNYYVRTGGDLLKDPVTGFYANAVDPGLAATWNFDSNPAATLSSSAPYNVETGVSTTTTIALTFERDINRFGTDDKVYVKQTASPFTVVETFDISADCSVINGTVTTPACTNLAAATEYTAYTHATALDDDDGIITNVAENAVIFTTA